MQLLAQEFPLRSIKFYLIISDILYMSIHFHICYSCHCNVIIVIHPAGYYDGTIKVYYCYSDLLKQDLRQMTEPKCNTIDSTANGDSPASTTTRNGLDSRR